MKVRSEKLGTHASVKGTMLEAHLVWTEAQVPDARLRLEAMLRPDCVGFVRTKLQATDWIPFHCQVTFGIFALSWTKVPVGVLPTSWTEPIQLLFGWVVRAPAVRKGKS